MSLSRTITRLAAEVRREARRNPEFADRLDAVLRAHVRRGGETPAEAVAEALAAEAAPAPAPEPAPAPAPDLNPVALFTRSGADALKAALDALPEPALAHLLGEHHLDPAGATSGQPKEAVVAHIVAQAQRRVERDRKLFDY